jgi:hypothetical protein
MVVKDIFPGVNLGTFQDRSFHVLATEGIFKAPHHFALGLVGKVADHKFFCVQTQFRIPVPLMEQPTMAIATVLLTTQGHEPAF